jgi:hypothetical protein
MLKVNGRGVIRWFQSANSFIEELLMQVSRMALMLGFVGATISMFTSKFGIASMPWFQVSWAIVQAIAVDGLFFVVWARVRDMQWSVLRGWYVFVGVLLAVVACLVNNVLSYQEMVQLPSVLDAMVHLGVTESVFSTVRSILVTLVAVLVVTLPRDGVQFETEKVKVCECDAVCELLPDGSRVAIGESVSDTTSDTTSSLVLPDGSRQAQIWAMIESGSPYQSIADELGISLSTVKRHAAKMKVVLGG